MLEGKDLPSCKLSDMITERLNIEIARELQLRAAGQGKSVHEIPPHERVEGLTVRVVCSGMKKCETKPKFYETFQSEHYPSEFPYRQRVLVLFQNLDGVDVCLFCMYVQEYGRDSPPPNTNVVYLSYLDR